MLGKHPIDVMLLATDLDAANEFYRDRIGLEAILETDDFVTFLCCGDSRLVVTRSSAGPADEATNASWRVDDLKAEVAELRSHRVEIQDIPDLNTMDGIADIGFALHHQGLQADAPTRWALYRYAHPDEPETVKAAA